VCGIYAVRCTAVTGRISVSSPAPLPPSQRRYACFNTVLDLSCDVTEDAGAWMLVFVSGRYGRNDTAGAARCHVPFTRNCDFDVQHPLSEACGGRRRCSVPVNTRFFGDPCGYDEFLTVVFRCVHGKGQIPLRYPDRRQVRS